MSESPNPLKWLLAELPGYIEPRVLDRLMEEYAANKRAYERQIAIRALSAKSRMRSIGRHPTNARYG